MEALDIKLLGREYRVACKPEEREGLLAAVTYLDEKMRDLAVKTNSAGERLAVMTALNITHEFLQFQRPAGLTSPRSSVESNTSTVASTAPWQSRKHSPKAQAGQKV
jgi:cell division protein ZapA